MALLSDRRRQIDSLLQEALQLDPKARSRFLDSKCGDDHGMREELQSRLAAAEKSSMDLDSPQQSPIDESVTTMPGRAIPPGTLLAHYKVGSMLGAGGMGQVYLAEDIQLGRKVALKVIAPKLARDEGG